jgi:hypothetical protein
MQMGTDIRKPKSSHNFGIQRSREGTIISTSGSESGRGGGGNELDEEERGADYTLARGFPLEDEDEDDDIERERQYLFHQAEMEAARRAVETTSEPEDEADAHRPWWRRKLKKSYDWIKQFVVPMPSSTTAVLENPQAPLRGVTYSREFKAPPGKRNFHLQLSN